MKTFQSIIMLLLTISVAIGDEPNPATIDAEKQAELDQLYVRVQVICPVSGQKLGAHGKPIKVAIGKDKQEVFLCCEACKTGKLDAVHWATIHKNIKQAQSTCAVMEKPLPEDSKFTIVDGKLVYVCCPPCIDKLQADPARLLAKVNESYAKYLAEKSVEP